MKTEIILEANKKIRKERPKRVDEICQVFFENRLLEIGFLSKQCQNDLKGCCAMCDYGCTSDSKDNTLYLEIMEKILLKYDNTFDCLLLCTNGSFMDNFQINDELYNNIISKANKYRFQKLEIETHYNNVTLDKLDVLKAIVSDKEVIIEMGLETINEEIQNGLIKKGISIEQYKEKIKLIQSYDFQIEINVLLGMPLLSSAEQLADALETTKWVFDNGCSVVIFPINIKPFTLLWHMYENGLYKPISNWLMIEYLINIPLEKLGEITIAWYGNREEIYEGSKDRVVFPYSCPVCQKKLKDFFYKFNSLKRNCERKELIDDLISSRECSCYDDLKDNLKLENDSVFNERLENCINWIQSNLLNKEL